MNGLRRCGSGRKRGFGSASVRLGTARSGWFGSKSGTKTQRAFLVRGGGRDGADADHAEAGHADFKTTQIYAEYAPSKDEADLVNRAFAATFALDESALVASRAAGN